MYGIAPAKKAEKTWSCQPPLSEATCRIIGLCQHWAIGNKWYLLNVLISSIGSLYLAQFWRILIDEPFFSLDLPVCRILQNSFFFLLPAEQVWEAIFFVYFCPCIYSPHVCVPRTAVASLPYSGVNKDLSCSFAVSWRFLLRRCHDYHLIPSRGGRMHPLHTSRL